jgi:hypothetical protein
MKFFPLLFLLFLTSCATELKYEMNNHKFLSPEAKGEFLKGDISLALQRDQKVVLATAYDAIIFNLPASTSANASVTKNTNISIPINLGLLEKVDFYTANFKYGFKYQFYGSSEKERKTEFKAALAAAYGEKYKNSGNVVFTNGNSSSRTYNTDLKLRSYELSFIFGKRLSESVLVYLNILRDYYSYKGALTSSQFAAINVSGKSVNQGGMLGINFLENSPTRPFTAKLEAGVVTGKLDNRKSITFGSYGAEAGWCW